MTELLDEFEFFFEKPWSDGLPVVAPTEERIGRMLAGTWRGPGELIGLIPPAMGISHRFSSILFSSSFSLDIKDHPSCPAFGRPHDDHGPLGAFDLALALGLGFDRADFGDDLVHRLGHQLMHLRRI